MISLQFLHFRRAIFASLLLKMLFVNKHNRYFQL